MNAMGLDTGWQKFSAGLALALSCMPAESYLVLNAADGRYARFYVSTPVLWCEIVHNERLAEAWRMPEPVEVVLQQRSWAAPIDGQSVSWHRLVAWPVPFRAYEVVADDVSVALCHGVRVGDPTELSIDAWIQNSNEEFNISALTDVIEG
ncbi:TY-Chap domain-containing protein [Nocardia tengchongensis]|uniref:TY-Chap domain-containing protein n=1 Tax=Nocardia tengchongensis TaxID=2055889 RepID=UPI0036C94F01